MAVGVRSVCFGTADYGSAVMVRQVDARQVRERSGWAVMERLGETWKGEAVKVARGESMKDEEWRSRWVWSGMVWHGPLRRSRLGGALFGGVG